MIKSKPKDLLILSTLFSQDGVPNVIFVDNSMEQTAGEFNNNSKDTDLRICTTEPFPPWMNQARVGL